MTSYKTPTWLHERVNDPFGTPNRKFVKAVGVLDGDRWIDNPFWAEVTVERVGNWKLFERDGIWYGYDTQHNAWCHFPTEAEAFEHASHGSVDVWA